MLSPFGIEHGISKGMSRNQMKGLAAVREGAPPAAGNIRPHTRKMYAIHRERAAKFGRMGSKAAGGKQRAKSREYQDDLYEGAIPNRYGPVKLP